MLNIAQLAAIAKGATTTITRQSITLFLLTAINLFKRFINIKPHLTIFKCTSFLNHLSRFCVEKIVWCAKTPLEKEQGFVISQLFMIRYGTEDLEPRSED